MTPRGKYDCLGGNIVWERSYPSGEPGYKTITHMFKHNYLVLDKTPTNVSKAVRRVTCARESDLDYDIMLQKNADYYLDLKKKSKWHEYYRKFIRAKRHLFHWHSRAVRDNIVAIDQFAKIPHVKRSLRMRALVDLINAGLMFDSTYVRIVKGKIKIPEWAKPMKYPRLITDYTTPGSLRCGFMFPYLKASLSEPFITSDDAEFEFVQKPDIQDLQRVFENLWHLRRRIYMPIFSDDSCISVRCEDGIAKFNIDQVSADNSVTGRTFDEFESICAQDPTMLEWAKCTRQQCMLPIKVSNPRNSRDWVKMKPRRENMGSGNSFTTCADTLDSFNGGLRFAFITRNQRLKVGDIPKLLTKAFADVGLRVTLTKVDCLEDFQFLKHSASSVNGVIVPWLNIGPMFRSIGNCDFDYPGRGDIMKRGFDRSCSIMEGFKLAGEHEVMDSLRGLCPPNGIPITDHYLVREITGDRATLPRIPLENISMRYKIPPDQFRYLLGHIRNTGYGHIVSDPVIDTIYSIDYG